MRIYSDACCLNRLTDDQSQPRIAEEAEAVEQILRLLRAKTIEWLSSAALKAEASNNPDAERRYEVEVLLLLATDTILLDGHIIHRAKELEALGYGAFDALHLSAAEAGNADVLLNTDDRFIKRAARAASRWRKAAGIAPQRDTISYHQTRMRTGTPRMSVFC